ncbi:sel1 repeat family protein [Calothrix sp. FACHB-1219]|uniref:tetratricopeptide repeat protein n=1 Tax=Calothrix sp. FACHB-1219 TaxID=2692778 RepID=UPI001689FC7A|nr:sel1 repeat family protein [Calothrix sp. FACHB-1219]MBD2222763.1 sel1 repeat family protein [Calothrix sp. FACHB-1219]
MKNIEQILKELRTCWARHRWSDPADWAYQFENAFGCACVDYEQIVTVAIALATQDKPLPDERSLIVSEMLGVWMCELSDRTARRAGNDILRWCVIQGSASAKLNLAISIFRREPKTRGESLPLPGRTVPTKFRFSRATIHELRLANDFLRQIISTVNVAKHVMGRALVVLGDSYKLGRGVEQDMECCVLLQERATEFDDPNALYNTGVLYGPGSEGARPRPLDCARAAAYYKRAMDLGHVAAQTNLGVLHATRQLPKSRPQYGLSLLRRSAAEGDTAAMDALEAFEPAGRCS